MIFLTVGSQMPFDRLVAAVDRWAESSPTTRVLGQIGNSELPLKSIQGVSTLPPDEFRRVVQDAEVIVAHAGMGSILTAMEYGKPLVVMPRKGNLLETRNDHQVATCQWLKDQGSVFIADDERYIADAIERALAKSQAREPISADASDALIEGVRRFIFGATADRT